jgi:predicted DNA-binding protein
MAKRKNDGLNASKRYNAKNPPISIRVTAEERKKLVEMAEKDGVTISTYVKRFLQGLITSKEEVEDEMIGEYIRGKSDGYSEARKQFEITLPCGICGGPITLIPGSRSHRLITAEHPMKHIDCQG